MQKQVPFDQAIKTKYPEQVVIVIAKDSAGKPNPVSIGWTMIASGKPPMMAVAVASKHYSTECIRHSKCFTIAFPSAEQADLTLYYGSISGRDADKINQKPCSNRPAENIDSIILDDAVANFECQLESETVAGDHIIFIGKIVASHLNEQQKKRL